MDQGNTTELGRIESLKIEWENMVNNINITAPQTDFEPNYILENRRRGELDYLKLGFPDHHHEDWKYTPVLRFLPKMGGSTVAELNGEVDIEFQKSFPFQEVEGIKIVLWNGRYIPHLSDSFVEEGLKVEGLESAFLDSQFEPIFNTLAKERPDAFTQFNTAKFDRGIFIRLKKGVQLKTPIHILYIFTGIEPEIQNIRNLILLEPFSDLHVLESQFTLDTVSGLTTNLFSNIVSEYFLEKGSHLENIQFQNLGAETRLLHTRIINQKQHSTYKSHVYSISGKLIRNNLQINLSEPEAEAHLYGFYSLHDQELMDNHTLVKHLKPHGQSNELYRGVLKGKSVGVFNGRVEVSQDAQKTNAYQQNQTILLSPEATMNSKPELEIFADDVKCSHGSTLGQLDPGALFYLRSRGITEKTAQKIMINAFAFSLISEISNKDIAQEISERIQELDT